METWLVSMPIVAFKINIHSLFLSDNTEPNQAGLVGVGQLLIKDA